MSFEPSTPLSDPRIWSFALRDARVNRGQVTVHDRTWYGARTQAAALLGCTHADLRCTESPFKLGCK